MNIRGIKDGIMNYVRQINQEDRVTRERNLRPTFDFEGWLAVLENSAVEVANVETQPAERIEAPVPVHERSIEWTGRVMGPGPNDSSANVNTTLPVEWVELDLNWNSNDWDNWGMIDWDTMVE